MKRIVTLCVLVVLGFCWLAFANRPVAAPYAWNLPPGFPEPTVPANNPMSAVKVQLGRHLFFDPRLSLTRMISCADCHQQKFAFSDPRILSVGATGQFTRRNSMTLTNTAYNASYDWANPNVTTLEHQMLTPLFGEDPIEMGLSGRREIVMAELAADPLYQRLFPAAFRRDDDPINWVNSMRAIASFSRTIISGDAPYDKYVRGDAEAMTESAIRGFELFLSEKLECFHCHGGFNFTDASTHERDREPPSVFHNTGLYNIDGLGAYPPGNEGLFSLSGKPGDMGRFKAPTLRNIALTAPYMHDGSIATLDGVIDHYQRGGRLVENGDLAGDGMLNPVKSEFVNGFELSAEERADLLAFLNALTDEDLANNPDLSNPRPELSGKEEIHDPR